jgi:hypothetical protein
MLKKDLAHSLKNVIQNGKACNFIIFKRGMLNLPFFPFSMVIGNSKCQWVLLFKVKR